VLPLGAGDVFLAVTTFAFDISVLEILLPLTRGARLVIAEREETLDAKRLAALIAVRGVTAMQATPATWSMLIESAWPGSPSLSALCGGEALSPALAAALRARCKRLSNVYGPTETTIWSSIDEVRNGAPVTIGYPLANNALYVLDERLEPQPCGMTGEIWIGGEGVSRGYFRRPGLTAGAFLPDPFAARSGARMYRTGDLGRQRDDGRIECLGRIDRQLKFRGFRIEPAEIEAALLAHDTVAQAAVALIGTGAAEQRLVAYVVAGAEQIVSVQDLRRHLQDILPGYLVPTHLIVLDAMPSTPNGKIDRAALPALSGDAVPAETMSAPAGEIESTLAEIWAAALQVDRVGAEQSFFDLGGHSLLLAKVRMAIAARLGTDVPMLELFRYPTIRALARHLGGAKTLPPDHDAADNVARQIAALGHVAKAAQASRARDG
jgi:acyl-coenzyme A synthetase/AMP-(fatty) acid ligase/acyl carrier protein